MPGSAYHRIAQQIADWLSVVPECGINCSSKSIRDAVRDTELEEDEEIVSFDVSSLYTNVPLLEAIQHCACVRVWRLEEMALRTCVFC